jgi:hypothetical protein
MMKGQDSFPVPRAKAAVDATTQPGVDRTSPEAQCARRRSRRTTIVLEAYI